MQVRGHDMVTYGAHLVPAIITHGNHLGKTPGWLGNLPGCRPDTCASGAPTRFR